MEMDFTRKFRLSDERDLEIKAILTTVYQALQEKGYNPINQIVGYILSEDPTYITNHNNAARWTGTSCCRLWLRTICFIKKQKFGAVLWEKHSAFLRILSLR